MYVFLQLILPLLMNDFFSNNVSEVRCFPGDICIKNHMRVLRVKLEGSVLNVTIKRLTSAYLIQRSMESMLLCMQGLWLNELLNRLKAIFGSWTRGLLCPAPAELGRPAIHPLDHEVGHRRTLSRPHQILPAKKLIAGDPIRLHIIVVHEHVSPRVSPRPLAPREHPSRENCCHPSRRVGPVPPRPVHKDNIPIDLVHLVGQVVEPQTALREEQILHGPALVAGRLPRGPHELGGVGQPRRILHVVGLDVRVALLHVGRVVPVLVDEDGSARMVEGPPEEGLVGEAEDEEAARGGGALADGVGHLAGVRVGHAVGGGGVG
ncbi:transcriptional regulator [Striga asiatica]|uniref:Transcriptional regulator n=1 Tax=Striga asiatica TaxID=4170 RepID=A0A5A7QMN2_STRAF|nr:transcriptional regulator [Striga asiatica]